MKKMHREQFYEELCLATLILKKGFQQLIGKKFLQENTNYSLFSAYLYTYLVCSHKLSARIFKTREKSTLVSASFDFK